MRGEQNKTRIWSFAMPSYATYVGYVGWEFMYDMYVTCVSAAREPPSCDVCDVDDKHVADGKRMKRKRLYR